MIIYFMCGMLLASSTYAQIEELPLNPHALQEYAARAQEYQKTNRNQEALELYQFIAHQDAHNFKALLNAGQLLHKMGHLDQASAYLSQALQYMPQESEQMMAIGNALLQLGNSYFDAHESEKAINSFKKILTISDSLNAVHHNIAFTMAEQVGAYEQSLEHYRIALQAKPDNSETHFCYSLSLLATGNLLQGFAEYEWRWKRFKHAPRQFNYPLPCLWTGEQNINGKRILINVEQGLGDTFMFIRYAQALKKMGAYVIAEVQAPLVRLLSLCPYIDQTVPIGSAMPSFDYQIPMINLPLAFKTELNTIPAQIPYLFADPTLADLWHQKLHNPVRTSSAETHLNIGICWRGDASHSEHKFMPFRYFEQLAQLPGITVYSLQKNDPASNITPADQAKGSSIRQFDKDFDSTHGRFMDTAAVMKNLDLVITVDTSIAHLAGGLGVPTWVVLPFPAEWRWLTQGDKSPWYSTMRLFRQKKFGEWDSVFQEIKQALCEKIK